MGGAAPEVLGLWVALLGVGLSLAALGFLAWVGYASRVGGVRLPPAPVVPLETNETPPKEPEEAQEGVLLLRPGGRVVYLNEAARAWFGLQPEERPHLESLARGVRPLETFLRLCAVPGKGEITLARRVFTLTSFPVPTVEGAAMVVVLRPASWGPEAQDEAGMGEAVLERLMALSRVLTDALGVDETLEAIFQVVDRLLPTDYVEITLWEEDEGRLRPYRYVGLAGLEHRVEHPETRYREGEGLTGYLLAHREPVLIPDVRASDHPALEVSRHRLPPSTRAYLGVPLLLGDKALGTLELAADEVGVFDERALRLVRWLAEQAAAALHRALAYEKVRAKAEQLEAQVTLLRSVVALHDAEAFVGRLVEAAATLTGASVVGLLLYREGAQVLEAQWPFLGVPQAFAETYRAPLPEEDEVWAPLAAPFLAPDAAEDAWFQRIGVADLARGAGIRDTLVVPLRTAERFLGILQLSNRAGRPFEAQDLGLAEEMARQIAPVLENFVLLQTQRERAYRAEALRRIANLVASEATLDETFRFVLQELSRLLQAPWAAVFLLDEARGVLEVHRPSVVGVDEQFAARWGRLSIQDETFAYTVTRTRRPFLSRDVQGDPRVVGLYRPLIEALPEVRSVLVVPLVMRDKGVGELLLGSPRIGAFQRNDVQLVSSVAGQLALAIEQQRLSQQSDRALAVRAEQMQALLRLSRELTLAPSLARVLEHLRQEVIRLTAADCATLRLLTPEGEVETQYLLLCTTDQAPTLSPRERQALEQGRPVALGVLPEGEQPHPGVRSALVVPLMYQNRPLGVLDLHAQGVDAFDEEQVRFAQGLGVQAALAVGLHREREAQLRQMARWQHKMATVGLLQEFFASRRLTDDPDALLAELVQLVMKGVGVREWAFYEYSESSGMLVPLQAGEAVALHDEPLVWERLAAHLEPLSSDGVYRLAPRYAVEVPWLQALDDGKASAWVVPLRSPEKALLGVVVLRLSDEDREEAEREEVHETLHLVAPIWALLLQWTRVRRVYRTEIQGLEAALEQAHTALQAAQQGVVRWLHKDLEQMVDTNALARSKERLEVALEIATIVNRQPDRQAVFDALGHELLERLAMGVVVLVEQVNGQLRLRQVYGAVPEGVRLESLLGQRSPIPEAMRTQQAILIGDLLHEATPWKDAPLLRRLQARAVLTIPVGIEEQPMAVALAVSGNSLPPFSHEDVQAFTLLGRQVGIALQNLRLLNEVTRRLEEVDLLLAFSRQLGELDLERLLNNLLESALSVISRAHAGFVALWDEQHRVLRVQAAQGYGDPEALLGLTMPVAGLLGEVFRSGEVRRIDEVDFVSTYPFEQEALLRYQQATLNRLPVSALVMPIASGEQVLGIVVVENFNTLAAFQESDENLLLALARQTGLMLENARLLEDTRTRATQLQALTNVATILTSTLQSEEVLASLLPQLATALPYDAATVWLRETEDVFVVQDARGFPDEEERKGVRVALKDSALLQTIVATEEPLLIPDTDEDETFSWPEGYPYRSWLGLPLIAQGEIVGLIVLEKAEPRFFTTERVDIARTFAAQAAAALQNARLYEESLQRAQELHERTARLELVYSFTAELSATLNPEHILTATIRRLRQALPLKRVGVAVYQEGELTLVVEEPPHGPLPRALPPLALVEQMAETKGVVLSLKPSQDERLAPWREELLRSAQEAGVVLFPLVTREVLHGVVVAQLNREGSLSPAELDLGRTLTQQAAVAYQNARLYEEMRHLTQELERRVAERTEELAREHRRAQILLRIITELASSLDLDQVLNRTLDLMNETLGSEQSTILLYRPDERGFYLRAARGYTDPPPPGGRPTAIPVEQSLAGWVLQHRQPVLISDLHQDSRWVPGPEGRPPHRSAVVVPLQVGEDVLGVFCLFHRQPGFFSPDHLDLAMAAGRQVAVAINNAELFNLIRDQSERLGQEVRRREVEASRARAILESVADGILVTDAKGKVTLFNPSAERLLGIPARQILGQSLERFSGLFGAAAGEWLTKVQQWSADPSRYQAGEVYEQRLDLEDGRVLSVRLTPVLTKREFLGTVSVFRDITHQVEVDRLKSEFVATVSHELRTPMTAIKGYVELLLKGVVGPLNEQQMQFLQIVHANTERLSTLVSDLLDISRIEAGKIAFTPAEVNLPEVVEEVLTEARRLAAEEGRPMTFESDLPADLPPVWADRERLHQILANLVDNGYRYTPEGGRVLVRARHHGAEVQVDVVDNGIGIPPDEQERVFERFYRGEHPLVMASAGTGLGLSIVRTLVEMHGGRIWVVSDGIPGKGSTFSFTLPVAEAVRKDAEGGQHGEDRDRGR